MKSQNDLEKTDDAGINKNQNNTKIIEKYYYYHYFIFFLSLLSFLFIFIVIYI